MRRPGPMANLSATQKCFYVGLGFLLLLILLPMPALADAFVDEYQSCLKTCNQACCEEICAYRGCVARVQTRWLNGFERKDPGAWSSALAVCQPFVQSINLCADENKKQSSQESSAPAIAPKPRQSISSSRNWRERSDQDFVDWLYKSILDRDADDGGRRHWLNLLSSGKSRESTIQWFFKSPEYRSRNKSDRDFIIDIYQALYGRNPTDSELSQALNKLSRINSRDQLVSQFVPVNGSSSKAPCPENTKRCRSLFMKGTLNLTKAERAEYEACSKRAEEIKACKEALKRK